VEINLLYSMGETLTTCLNVNELPQLVLTEASQVIVKAYHQYISQEARLDLGFGINTKVVVVGNLGTEDPMEYTAKGT
jgi:class 3 adenylate cyclase